MYEEQTLNWSKIQANNRRPLLSKNRIEGGKKEQSKLFVRNMEGNTEYDTCYSNASHVNWPTAASLVMGVN